MSTIPKSREHLVEMTEANFGKLRREIEDGGEGIAELRCTEDWTVKQLLAVRVWWTESVVRWVKTGRRGTRPVTPARGYRWHETPRLNDDIAARAEEATFASIVKRLDRGYASLMKLIASLSDDELLAVGVFEWAGKYPIARWLSLNTARQYTTARALIRKAIRLR